MKLDSIHHVAIIVSDYERSRNFYVGLLGFEVIRENYRKERGDYKLDLKLGDCELEISAFREVPKDPAIRKPAVCATWPSVFPIWMRPSPGSMDLALKRNRCGSMNSRRKE